MQLMGSGPTRGRFSSGGVYVFDSGQGLCNGSRTVNEELRYRAQRPVLQLHDADWPGLNGQFDRQHFERQIPRAKMQDGSGERRNKASGRNQFAAKVHGERGHRSSR